MTTTLCVLGATGSIGTQVLDVVRQFPNRFSIHSLAAGKNLTRLASQILEFQPKTVVIQHPADIEALQAMLRGRLQAPVEILAGEQALCDLPTDSAVQTVIVGLVGLNGLSPTLNALKAGKKVLTANKETFVAGGHLVQPYLKQILPVDSEHSAIHQCLNGLTPDTIQTIYLTASGGPFRTHSISDLQHVTKAQALKHPNWVMGEKITIDSATMMNKGLEVIEAHWLFGVNYDRINILVHPQSVIHSGVELVDGAMLFQMGAADMRGPIQYAMFHPERVNTPFETCRLDLLRINTLALEAPDLERFPCIRLAYEAGQMGHSATTVLNAADEMAVELFLNERIRFPQIAALIEQTLTQHAKDGLVNNPSLEEIKTLDDWARDYLRQQAMAAAV